MDLAKVISEPLSLCMLTALSALFDFAGLYAKGRGAAGNRWIIPAAYTLALLCIIGGLGLAYEKQLDDRRLQEEAIANREKTRQERIAADSLARAHAQKVQYGRTSLDVNSGIQTTRYVMRVNSPSTQSESILAGKSVLLFVPIRSRLVRSALSSSAELAPTLPSRGIIPMSIYISEARDFTAPVMSMAENHFAGSLFEDAMVMNKRI